MNGYRENVFHRASASNNRSVLDVLLPILKDAHNRQARAVKDAVGLPGFSSDLAMLVTTFAHDPLNVVSAQRKHPEDRLDDTPLMRLCDPHRFRLSRSDRLDGDQLLADTLESARLLIDYGANPNYRNSEGHTVLDLCLAGIPKLRKRTQFSLSCWEPSHPRALQIHAKILKRAAEEEAILLSMASYLESVTASHGISSPPPRKKQRKSTPSGNYAQ